MSRVIREGERIAVGRRANVLARIGLLLVGVWLTVAPFALEYGDGGATVNDTLTGVLVVTLALCSLTVPGPSPRP